MNKETKRVIREIEANNVIFARKFCETLHKIELIKVTLPNYVMPHNAAHKEALIEAHRANNCHHFATRLSTYNQERIKRIRKWRMVVP